MISDGKQHYPAVKRWYYLQEQHQKKMMVIFIAWDVFICLEQK